MPDCLEPWYSDPASFMAPSGDRLSAFADGLADDGEADLSDLVRSVAEGLADARGDNGEAEVGWVQRITRA